ncbi:hypothetical protein ACHAXR_011722 [Thalassiosira sp. AJA248-18]
MCGRAAYSARAISTAAAAFSHGGVTKEDGATGHPTKSAQSAKEATQLMIPIEIKDRPNTSPGNEFHVFRRSKKLVNDVELEHNMIWGLIPNNGTRHSPHLLPTNPEYSVSPHYVMFNARSETLYDKRSFSGLIRNGQTCVLAVDGYYEWTKPQSLQSKKKQPYFVCYKDKQKPLLLAGLWASVKTGRTIKSSKTNSTEEEETITTFTILTTDAHPKYTWLHPRQPVILWDISIALEWLMSPSPAVVEKLRSVPMSEQSIWENPLSTLQIYPVGNRINDGKYQGDDCTVEVKLETTPSVKSFWGVSKKAKTEIKCIQTDDDAPPHPVPENESSKCKELFTEQNSQEEVSRKNISEEESLTWTCSQCTYIHNGPVKYEYLACALCGSERIDDQDTSLNESSKKSAEDGDRKRKAAF